MSSDFGSDRTGDALEQLCCDAIRILAMDAVEAADCGHPGMPMGMAEVAHVLWTEFLRLDPQDPDWAGRDRFVLSGGHGSMLLYSLLHFAGFGLPLEEIKRFRQLGSHTPGHPENYETRGVETTTGPLGQGVGNAVGMAIAQAHLAARFPAAAEVLAQKTYVMAGDGDLMEGVASEAASLAGHLGLRHLVLLYDDNHISIDGSTELAFGEDVLLRFQAYGWETSRVDGHDRAAVRAALQQAQAAERPVIIACRTIIGRGAPNKQGTSGVHGSKLGAAEVKAAKEQLGWPQEPFLVPDAVRARWARRQAEWREARAAWDRRWEALDAGTRGALEALASGRVDLSAVKWPAFAAGKKIATRSASGEVLNALAPHVPNLIGGSADLTGSVNTYLDASHDLQRGAYDGRNLRYGVREHAMAAAMNGMALHRSGLIPYAGTFLVFSDYSRPSIRLAALMDLHLVHVLTHDAVWLGEDGPTHQPVEHYMALRAIPRLRFWRPADATETAEVWRCALEQRAPHAVALSRQGLPVLDRARLAPAEGVRRGGYVLSREQGAAPDLVLIATGSEVALALEVADALAAKGRAVRVVSLPCWEVFEEQDEAYREEVIPPTCGARVSLESGVTFGWERWTGPLGLRVGIDRFGASAPLADLQKLFGFTRDQVLARVEAYLEAR